jgi:hypothetical protein
MERNAKETNFGVKAVKTLQAYRHVSKLSAYPHSAVIFEGSSIVNDEWIK